MIIDRLLGAVADLEQPLDHWHDPSLEPNWANKHPTEIDPTISLEKIIEADRAARRHIEGMRKEREEFQPRQETGPCEDCDDEYPCEYHATAEELAKPEEEIVMTARGMRNPGHLPRPPLLSTNKASSASTPQTTSTTPNLPSRRGDSRIATHQPIL